jgi:Mn2+/Fe2+ NRAMP family transporter
VGSVLNHTLIPHIELNKAYLMLLVVVLGTTISPYLFFWQSAHRLEEMRDEPEGGAKARPLKQQDPTGPAQTLHQPPGRLHRHEFSNVVMFAIIVATAQTLHHHGKTSIHTAAQAACYSLTAMYSTVAVALA